jgi:hypothetical protein
VVRSDTDLGRRRLVASELPPERHRVLQLRAAGRESGPFGGTYTDNQDQDCYTPCTDFVTDCAPAYPTVDQFQQWGLYDADEAQTNTPDYYSAMVGTSVSMGVGLTAALGCRPFPLRLAHAAAVCRHPAIRRD